MIDFSVMTEKWNKRERKSEGKKKSNQRAKEEIKMSSRSKEIMRMLQHINGQRGALHQEAKIEHTTYNRQKCLVMALYH